MLHLSPLYRINKRFDNWNVKIYGFWRFCMQFLVWFNFFAVLDDFSYGFAVSNRPQSPPPQRLVRENSYPSYCLVPLLQELFEKENEGDVPLLNGVNPNETLEPKVLLYGKYISLSLFFYFFFLTKTLLVQQLVSWTSYQGTCHGQVFLH